MAKKTFAEINEKIKKGEAVVLTAEEVVAMADEQGLKATAEKVDVVTTATFGPMCSSGAFLNFGHSDPPIKMAKVWLNQVPAYTGIAAVDAYIGATELAEGRDDYGGAHVIEELVAGKSVRLKAIAQGTDCYPRKELEGYISRESINEAFLFNPRNAYQNYGAATNSTGRILYTYMGMLLPKFGNVTYSTAGQLSPLLNDPYLRTIGVGTRIFLGGTQGYVAWHGTQHNPSKARGENGVPVGGAGTLSLIGDLKAMTTEYLKAAVFKNYGVSMFVGVGIPIPMLDEDMARFVTVRDREIKTTLLDYGVPGRSRPTLKVVDYAELKSGFVELNGRKVRTAPLSSIYKARQIAATLKEWIERGEFMLQEPAAPLPADATVKPLDVKELD
ncbi:homocysteine biosynthesis protein [Anaeroselena agilis]|uniref:Homocysteine biosynthesis protein n=1 Tax=Anaeroselena agilis TaxID=3063788 RepID=A0ABU3P1G0_9FIRM|nr:homocysteine biosynthesis protein [Selenomonadales bacterium 4137-cl]